MTSKKRRRYCLKVLKMPHLTTFNLVFSVECFFAKKIKFFL